ncbi:MAG: cyclase family protein [Acidobacteriota bacterium]
MLILMQIFDVTVPISKNVPIYAGDPPVSINTFASIAAGDAANVSEISFGVHTATHIDAPNHFIPGAATVDQIELETLIGRCRVVAVGEDILEIGVEHLPNLNEVERLIFKTRNSDFWNTPEEGFRTDYTYLSHWAAEIIAASGIRLVGIDYLSIEKPASTGHPVHKTLLEKGIVILEGLDLRGIEPGDYKIICLPLKYSGGTGDGAPARTVLIKG